MSVNLKAIHDGAVLEAKIDRRNLRDYFAAAALQGLLQNPDRYEAASDAPSVKTFGESMARMAYGWADAMLAQREKVKP